MASGSSNDNDITGSNIPAGLFSSESEKRRLMHAVASSKNQNEADRRQIRQNYRLFMEDLSDNKQALIDPADEENLLNQKLKTVDKLFANVSEAREGSLDSTSLVQIADLGMKKAQALQTDFARFSPADFCEKVKVVITGELDSSDNNPFSDQHWLRLGHAVEHLFQKTPVLRFMCGSFERGEVSAKRRIKKDREDKLMNKSSDKETKPTQLSKFETVKGGELTTAYVEHVLKSLWGVYEETEGEPVDFFEFVTHPTSFGQTVENIFYTSFLIRDGHVKMSLDSEELPVLEPIPSVEVGTNNEESSDRRQLVMQITPSQWKKIVSSFKIEEPVIKPMVVDLDPSQRR